MEKKKRNLIKGTLVAGAMLSISTLSATPNASNLFDYNALGSGAEVRTEILGSNGTPLNTFEANCGEKAKTKKAETKSAEAKCGEGKCGEGKCGEKKAKAKKGKKAAAVESKAKDAKCGEGKCGEGKCGEKKAEKKKKQ